MRKKIIKTLAMCCALTTLLSVPTFAGQWKQDHKGWWYQNDDCTYQKEKWFEDKDGCWYYFDKEGYMLNDAVTPDGYYVGKDGAWVKAVQQWACSNETLNKYRDVDVDPGFVVTPPSDTNGVLHLMKPDYCDPKMLIIPNGFGNRGMLK